MATIKVGQCLSKWITINTLCYAGGTLKHFYWSALWNIFGITVLHNEMFLLWPHLFFSSNTIYKSSRSFPLISAIIPFNKIDHNSLNFTFARTLYTIDCLHQRFSTAASGRPFYWNFNRFRNIKISKMYLEINVTVQNLPFNK